MLQAECMLPHLFFYNGLHLAAIPASGGDEFVYSGFAAGGGSNNLILDGTAMVTPADLLELTNGSALSKGHAFHPTPLRLRENKAAAAVPAAIRSFSAFFVFGIVPAGAAGEEGGHGLALVVSRTPDLSSGVASSYLGLLNGRCILGIELDTVTSPESGHVARGAGGVAGGVDVASADR